MRFVVVIGLLLSLVVLGSGALQSWKEKELPSMPEVSEKKRTASTGDRQDLLFNPQVPSVLPDLNTGYLFNEQRSISEEEGEEPAAAESVADLSSQINMDSLVYVGSIIIGEVRKGMVSFVSQEGAAAPSAARQRRGRPLSRRPSAQAAMENATVNEGEDFYGYKVSEVKPDRILFSKNGARVEKLLYDPEKKRAEPVALNRPAAGNAPVGNVSVNQGGAVVPLPRPGAAGPRGRVTPPVPQQESGAAPGVVTLQPDQPGADEAPVVEPSQPRTSIPRRTVRRPQVIQRRRLPAQSGR